MTLDDNSKVIKAFRLFNEKADKLARLSFIQHMMQEGTGVTLSYNLREDGLYEQRHERRGPDEESIDAFVLTFRFFIQDNEQSSFRKMADHYTKASIKEELKDKFVQVRKAINELLDRPSSINFSYNGELLTNRKIMDTFVYGGMSHATEAKKQLYDEWMAFPPAKLMMEYAFTDILASLVNAVMYIKHLNDEALQELPSSS